MSQPIQPQQSSNGAAEIWNLQQQLLGQDLVVWQLNHAANHFAITGAASSLAVHLLKDIQTVTDLLHLLGNEQAERFSLSFNSAPNVEQGWVTCPIQIQHPQGNFDFRILGQFVGGTQPQWQGFLVPSEHWLDVRRKPEPSRNMDVWFYKNPQASALFDSSGTLINVNPALANIFNLRWGAMRRAFGQFNLFKDTLLASEPMICSKLNEVFREQRSGSIEFAYPLDRFNDDPQYNGQQLWLRAYLAPVLSPSQQLRHVVIQLQDLSSEKHALQILLKQQKELQESEASYKAFIANSSEAIWCYDMVPPIAIDQPREVQALQIAERARLSQANKVLVTMLGAKNFDDVVGTGLRDSGSTQYKFDVNVFVDNNYQLADFSITREFQRGKMFYFEISCVGIVEGNFLTRVWGTTKDVTQGQRYKKNLEHMSTHDALTGMPNRSYLQGEIERYFALAEQSTAALLLIDLDRFKEINDTLGHQAGDRLLCLIGPQLKSELDDVDSIVVRMGGDEFAVFLPKIRNNQHAVVLASRLIDTLRHGFEVEGNNLSINASIGIAYAPDQSKDAAQLLRFADVAMYHAKEQLMGISSYSIDIDPNSNKRLLLRSELGRAIKENQLSLHFQPKINLKTKTLFGFEALVRWYHPVEGFISPAEFIPYAEKSSTIHDLTAWVLENAIAQCKRWRESGLLVSVAVNLSARNLLDESIPRKVKNLLTKYALVPEAIELEITESSIMVDPNRALDVLKALHEEGVHLSIDDFGTGYSSLAYLKKLPVQTLKIDNSFIRNMLSDHQDELIVGTTVQLAHSFNLQVVAEGVEDGALVERLQSMGCDHGQGYFFAKPMPADQLDGWLKNTPWYLPSPTS